MQLRVNAEIEQEEEVQNFKKWCVKLYSIVSAYLSLRRCLRRFVPLFRPPEDY